MPRNASRAQRTTDNRQESRIPQSDDSTERHDREPAAGARGRPATIGLTCRDVVELATEYFEASLRPERSRQFAAHVAGCEGCQTYLRQLRITVDIVHTVAGPEPVDTSALLSGLRAWRRAGGADPGAP